MKAFETCVLGAAALCLSAGAGTTHLTAENVVLAAPAGDWLSVTDVAKPGEIVKAVHAAGKRGVLAPFVAGKTDMTFAEWFHRDGLRWHAVGVTTLADARAALEAGANTVVATNAAALLAEEAASLKPVNSLMTEWGAKVTPENAWREYPRPQMARASWMCLNGLWDYAITGQHDPQPTKWDGRILVPFAFESRLSGVGRLIKPAELMWYRRTLELDPKVGERILLNFEAVDYRAEVFVNGIEVTDVPHDGGQLPFSLDITSAAKKGTNELVVCVWDPTETFIGSYGKQYQRPAGCFYTRCSGIWQTVWLETVPEMYIEGYEVVTDIDKGTVAIEVKVKGQGQGRTEISVFDPDGNKVGTLLSTPTPYLYTFSLPSPRLWSPEEPNLYTFKATCGKDAVTGYFGMRKVEVCKDRKGIPTVYFNNQPKYMMGTLDQGWWPDGLLTPPSDEAMASDILMLKASGFNMLRKHIKVEPRRYYYLCDKLGLALMQDMPSSSNGPTPPNDVTTREYARYRAEWKGVVEHLVNVPSIWCWVPYNEGWGQPQATKTAWTFAWTKRRDPSRLVDGPSGWYDFDGGYLEHGADKPFVPAQLANLPPEAHADLVDMHRYPGPAMPPVQPSRVSFLGEFGGIGLSVKGHLWNGEGRSWGYVTDDSTEKSQARYLALIDELAKLAAAGLGGSVYTQTSDVEGEVNGLVTYDRKVRKYDAAALRKAHDKVYAAFAERTGK